MSLFNRSSRLALRGRSSFIRLKRSRFVRNVITLTSGTAVAQLITIAAIPLISRLFNPDEFGVAALFLSIVTLLSVLATLKFDQAIVLPKSNATAINLLVLSAILSGGFSFFLLLLIFIVLLSFGGNASDINTLGYWLFLVPLGVFLLSSSNIASGFATRQKAFRGIAYGDVAQSISVSVTRILAGLSHFGVGGLICALLIGFLVKILVIYKNIISNYRFRLINLRDAHIMGLFREYKQFPLYSMPTALLRSLGGNIQILALAFLFDPTIVGYYAMGIRLLQMPLNLFSNAIGRTYLQKSSELLNKNKSLTKPFVQTTIALSLLGILTISPIALFGEEIFALVLGNHWSTAGLYAEILTPFLFTFFVITPASTMFVVLRRQAFLLKIRILSTLSMLLVFFVAYLQGFEPNLTLACFSITGSAFNVLVVYMGYQVTKSISIELSDN